MRIPNKTTMYIHKGNIFSLVSNILFESLELSPAPLPNFIPEYHPSFPTSCTEYLLRAIAIGRKTCRRTMVIIMVPGHMKNWTREEQYLHVILNCPPFNIKKKRNIDHTMSQI